MPNEHGATSRPTLAYSPRDLLFDLLRRTATSGASDLHLKVGVLPTLRHEGDLIPVEDVPILTSQTILDFLRVMLTPHKFKTYEETHDLDVGFKLEGVSRFRVNVAQQRGTPTIAIRVTPDVPPTWEELGIPEVCKEFVRGRAGLVLVTGATGAGKSTTLAAMID